MIGRFLVGFLLALSLVASLHPRALAVQAALPRHPAPSPDGSHIVFSWQGDLWMVERAGGDAHRMTVHPAEDRHPVCSPDGEWLAFASNRHGTYDVFVMPADGHAPPRRLSFASRADVPLDFTEDSRHVLFMSRRDESTRKMSAFYAIPLEGGTPALVQSAHGVWGARSPDGTRWAFVRGHTSWWRQGYRGSGNREVWLRTATNEFSQLTDFDGDDDRPCWVDDETLLFISTREGAKNLFTLDIGTGAARRLTSHETDVRYPKTSADGSVVAYELWDGIYTAGLPDGEPMKLSITVASDYTQNPEVSKIDRKGCSELVVHPDGDMAAIVVHGNVFVLEMKSKEEQEIAPCRTTAVTTGAPRERDVSWSPDGRSLLFSSDRDGTLDVYAAGPVDPDAGWIGSYDFDLRRITDSPHEDHSARYSPSGDRIAFVRERGELVVVPATGGEETVLAQHFRTPDFRWSPDGAWIAYAVSDVEYNPDVWIIPADGGTPYNVSRHPDGDGSPRWSPDGKRLIWVSKRHADTYDLWGVWLTREDHERSPDSWLRYWMKDNDGKSASQEAGNDTDDEPTADLPVVRIDFENLWERSAPITSLKGNEDQPLMSPDSKHLAFRSEHEDEQDLYLVRWDGKDLKRLTTGGQEPTNLQFLPDGTTICYLDKDGVAKRVSLEGKPGDPMPYEARYEVNLLEQRAQVFDEAWRHVNLWYYDPEFHGVDWSEQRERYRPLALAASHDQDFADVFRLMLGELNSSHVWFSPKRGDKGEATGWIGALFDPAGGGPGIRISEVLPHSPAAHAGVDLQAGDRILSVDGATVAAQTNIYGLFAGTTNRTVHLEILEEGGDTRRVTVRPVGWRDHRQLRYDEWVRQRRHMVDRLSSERLGYLHIKGMNIPSFEDFERDLYAAAHGKEALIIDVRSNSGGWTTDYLLAVLTVHRHAYTLARGVDPSTRAYPQVRLPLSAWTRPALALCNEESYSNAEIFSHAFKTLDRGPLVGVPTFGGVISTGSTKLLDGSSVSLPGRGWFVADTGLDMEKNGAVPDVIVAQPPDEDTASDRDTQLATAVEVLLSTLETDPRAGSW